MKKLIFILTLLSCLWLSGCKTAPEGVAARVFDMDITFDELENAFNNFKNIYLMSAEKGKAGAADDLEIQKSVLENLIMRKILQQKFYEEGLQITKADMASMKERKFSEMGGRNNFEKFLRNNKIDEAFYDEAIREEIMRNGLLKVFANGKSYSDEELRKEFDDNTDCYRAYDISLIVVTDKKIAEEIYSSTEPFEELVILYSEDAETAIEGGRITRFTVKGDYEPLLNALEAVDEEELTKPVLIDGRYYIAKLHSKLETFESSKEQVRDALLQRDFKAYIDELREKADVKLYKKFEAEEDVKD